MKHAQPKSFCRRRCEIDVTVLPKFIDIRSILPTNIKCPITALSTMGKLNYRNTLGVKPTAEPTAESDNRSSHIVEGRP